MTDEKKLDFPSKQDLCDEIDRLADQLAAERERSKGLREALRDAIEYLEPRLANKHGSRGLTIVLPKLRAAYDKSAGGAE